MNHRRRHVLYSLSDGHLTTTSTASTEVSTTRDSGLDFSNRSDIWQATRSCQPHFCAMWSLEHPISRLRDFTRFGGKASYRLANRCPGVHLVDNTRMCVNAPKQRTLSLMSPHRLHISCSYQHGIIHYFYELEFKYFAWIKIIPWFDQWMGHH